jgi:hypothetical protein
MADNVWNEGKQLTCMPLDGITSMFHGEQGGSCVGICCDFDANFVMRDIPADEQFTI